jgi:hypothetical protein
MNSLPLALTSCLLILVSITIGERTIVIFSAMALFTFGLLTTLFLQHRYKTYSARKMRPLIVIACLAIFVSVPITNWPLRVSFKLWRSSFDKIASSLQTGKTFPKPIQVGFFSVKKAEVYKLNGKICLWTNLDPAGKTGFTKCPINDVPFNLWSIIHLDKEWQFVSED